MQQRSELKWPADLYLEGADQYRGWFQSSLLTSVATRGTAPYKAVVTHGWVVDGEGRKMSKSIGNVIAPQELIEKFGAEIVRLWVSSVEYREDIRISDQILGRLVDAYRRIRNTLRFLLANTNDFDITKDAVPVDQMLELDRWALARVAELQQQVAKANESYSFQQVSSLLMGFATDDLGSFYLDILKDRLYTTKADGLPRRSAQTALWHITATYLRLMAPILSFTAEEAFAIFSPNQDGTIFTETYHKVPETADADQLLAKWALIRELRAEVLKKIEELRMQSLVGSSLQAECTITASGEAYEALASLGNELKFVLMTSRAELVKGEGELAVEVTPTKQTKCCRCWHYVPSVGSNSEHPDLCERCLTNLFGAGEVRTKA